ncbi:TPA: glycosyl transferase [Candidatus Latescibacteria bacterium]|nr:glycosyl transferase [Gemmatimonadota bacterium]HAA74490.1 glycosyl transferase [Candidatus Latescibacterota bacterium]
MSIQTLERNGHTTSTGNRVTVVIPARNEAPSIGKIIKGCALYADEILVVDGHSTDGTVEIAQELGARIVTDNGVGKGDAIRVGIEHATGDVTVFIDADGSHSPDDIPGMVQPIHDDVADLVVGSRMRGGSDELHGDFMKFLRLVGSDIITLGINYRFGVGLTDTQNGFRAIRTTTARHLNLVEDITTIEQEMGIKTLHAGYRVSEIPSHEYERSHGDSCIKLRKVWFRYVYTWLKYLFVGGWSCVKPEVSAKKEKALATR